MTPDPNAVLLAQGAMGADADDFMRSDLGRTLIGMARIEAKVALDALKTVNPSQSRKIQELQNQIWLAERFEGWLTELVMRGRQAITQYDMRTSDNLDGDEDGSETQGTQQPEPNTD